MSFSWEIKVKGFGPFAAQAGGKMTLGSSRVALYSGNGQGKTCMSRLFRAADSDAGGVSDSVINRDGNSGAFTFAIAENGAQVGELSISMNRGGNPTITNGTDYIFHVFNSDYVRDNLGSLHYSPNGDGFTGYIIGRENIDVSDKKVQLDDLEKQGKEKREAIDDAVSEARARLAELGLTRLKGYRELTTQKILAMDACTCQLDDKLVEFEALRGLPDVIPTLAGLSFDTSQIDFEGIKALLAHAYSRDKFADEFIEAVQPKRDFVKTGLGLIKDDTCPFCGTSFDEKARDLIRSYEEYVQGQEAKTIGVIEGHAQQIKTLRRMYEQLLVHYQGKMSQFNQLRLAFPTLGDAALPDLPPLTELDAAIDALTGILTKKAADISVVFDDAELDTLQSLIAKISSCIVDADELLAKFDALAGKASTALTAVKQDLCTEMANKVRNDCDTLIAEREAIGRDYQLLDKEIKEAEARSRRSKREAIAEMLERLILEVFGDRYTFDPERFTISLGNSLLGDEAEEIMSDGEKSALAFCHFIASTWNLLDSDTDAEKLFFVIDDPISSLDYHYVYSIVQIIRDLNVAFGLSRVRFFLMTHNSAFFNMLARNKIAKDHFILHDGVIESCKSHYITPYSEHLKDLYKVAAGVSGPTHTTGNSIRQIIEALWRFDNPAAKDLLDYLNTEACHELKNCEYIYTVCQDQSHGASLFDRDQPPEDEAIRRACWAVLNHVHEKYPGQLIASSISFEELSQQVAAEQ